MELTNFTDIKKTVSEIFGLKNLVVCRTARCVLIHIQPSGLKDAFPNPFGIAKAVHYVPNMQKLRAL